MMPMWDEGHLVGVVKIIRDLTDRVEAEQRRQLHTEQLAQQFQQLAESIPHLVWISDVQGRDLYFNPQWETFSGLSTEQLVNNGWHALIAEDAREHIVAERAQAIADERGWEATFQMQTASDGLHWCLCRALPIRNFDGEVIRWFSTCTDVDAMQNRSSGFEQDAVALRSLNASQEVALGQSHQDLRDERHTRESAEQQVRQLQKMEAVGQLTGGIAHDFNNMLTVIMGGLNMLQARLRRGDTQVDRYADLALEGTTRAAELTHRLLAFARRQTLDPRPVDVNDLILSLEELFQRTLGERISLRSSLALQLPPARTDTNQLENALLNLVINARDAMPEGGQLTLETALDHLTDLAAEHDLPPGDYVRLTIADTGSGMPAEVVDRAFDPFFTTKPIGQGTGLGLSMLYGFIKQSGGHVTLESELGSGTRVSLWLPCAQPERPAASATPQAAIAQSRGERLLLVEDDVSVRLLLREMLTELGYRVRTAASASAALTLVDGDLPCDLLITDLGLPDLDGAELAGRLRERWPELPVLFVSGHAERPTPNGEPSLAKPFQIDALARLLRQLLD